MTGLSKESNFPVPRAVPYLDRIGFSPALPEYLRTLNDVLARVSPPTSVGLNLELKPDATTPEIEFKPHVENPFKIELAGLEEGLAVLRISTSKRLDGDVSVEFPDVREFVKSTFGDHLASFYAAPSIHNQGPIYIEANRKVPTSLYEEQRDSRWREIIDDARKKSIERMFHGLLPTIEIDIDQITDDQIRSISEKVEAIKINATFYNKWDERPRHRRVSRKESFLSPVFPQLYSEFDIRLDDQSEPLLNMGLFHYGAPYCVFQQLSYRGDPIKVEQVIQGFSELMKKTPSYLQSEGINL